MLSISSLIFQSRLSSRSTPPKNKICQGSVAGIMLIAEVTSVLGVGVILGLSLSGTLPISSIFAIIPGGGFFVFLVLDGGNCILNLKLGLSSSDSETEDTNKKLTSSDSRSQVFGFKDTMLKIKNPHDDHLASSDVIEHTQMLQEEPDFWQISDFIEQNYKVVVAPWLEKKKLAEILALRPVLLIGESHNCPQHRENHGRIINQLNHENAILLAETQHKSQNKQAKHVDLKIIEKSKCWDFKKENPLKIYCQHLFIHLNAVKRVIRIVKGRGREDDDFDGILSRHIKLFPNQIKYQELQKLLQKPLFDEDSQLKFFKHMLQIISETDSHMDPIFRADMQDRDQSLCDSVIQEVNNKNNQVFLIAGLMHINDQVFRFLKNHQIDYIALIPKQEMSNKDICSELAVSSSEKSSSNRPDDLENAIVMASCNYFPPTGPMSMYNINPVLTVYCEEIVKKLASSKN